MTLFHVYLKWIEWGIGSTEEMFQSHSADHPLSPFQGGSTATCEHQALAQSSAPSRNGWTSDTLLPQCLRHSRHRISPTPISAGDYSRCQHRLLIRSVHNKIAVCLSSSLTCFSVSCWSTAHAMEIVSSRLYHPVCHSPPHSANLYQTQLLAKARPVLALGSLVHK